jgi:peptide/nickel transport system permease protein
MDYVLRSISIALIALPAFWIATLVMIYPSVWWGWSPSVELIPFGTDPLGNLGMFIIPGLINGFMMSGMSMRLIRTQMLEVARQDYIRTAWAKGLDEKTVLVRHAVRNAFLPVLTMWGGSIGMIFGGSIIMEQIFCLPGTGMLMLQALNNRDYPLVCGITLFMSIIVMLANLLTDISYTWLDPRIKFD